MAKKKCEREVEYELWTADYVVNSIDATEE